MLGDVGQRLLGDAVQRQPDGGRHATGRPVGAQRDVQPGPREFSDEDADFVDAGFGRGLSAPAGGVVEQPDGAPNVGHRLPAEMLRLFQGLDRVIDVAVLLQHPACPRDVQQSDAKRVGDHVVHFARDASPFVGGGVLGQHLLRLDLFGQQQALGAHQVTEQPTRRNETQVQRHRVEAVQRGRGQQQRGRRHGGQEAARPEAQRADGSDHQHQQCRCEIGTDRRGRAEQHQRGRR
ncbi:hypothetical protein AWC19_17985 [Mycobacterium palustre]|uniref:Uncharacterized protein n=1 Tax=Mycobacterium palustre TaxID=153971 RepID=A0A1X1Z5L7_9MYCO|nr:hypothetical protein AWC19_17985 [Mycobacterium palustre]